MINYGLMEIGIISAVRYAAYVGMISVSVAAFCSSITVVWHEKSNTFARISQTLLILAFFLILFLAIYLDGQGSLPNVDSRNPRFVFLLFLIFSALVAYPLISKTSRLSFVATFPISVPIGLLGGIAGFIIGYPSFGQTAFGQIGAVIFSGFGILLSFIALRNEFGISSENQNNEKAGSNIWMIASAFSFVLAGFLTFTASGTWGYAVRGFEYCGELYGPHIASDSPSLSVVDNGKQNRADQLFYGFCRDVLSSFSGPIRSTD